MASDPMHAFYGSNFDLLESIEDCFAKPRHLPCLILLYAGIDGVATLGCEPGKGTRADFIAWADKCQPASKPALFVDEGVIAWWKRSVVLTPRIPNRAPSAEAKAPASS